MQVCRGQSQEICHWQLRFSVSREAQPLCHCSGHVGMMCAWQPRGAVLGKAEGTFAVSSGSCGRLWWCARVVYRVPKVGRCSTWGGQSSESVWWGSGGGAWTVKRAEAPGAIGVVREALRTLASFQGQVRCEVESTGPRKENDGSSRLPCIQRWLQCSPEVC